VKVPLEAKSAVVLPMGATGGTNDGEGAPAEDEEEEEEGATAPLD
jgi:hypothetical protein